MALEVDYESLADAADAFEQVIAHTSVESIYMDYDGDFGHEALEGATSTFLAHWQQGGKDLALAHLGIATDLRESVAWFRLVDSIQGEWYESVADKVRDFLGGS